MTPKQVHVLGKCCYKDVKYRMFDGLNSNLAWNYGWTRQLRWLKEHGLIYMRHGRWFANVSGRKVYEHQTSNR